MEGPQAAARHRVTTKSGGIFDFFFQLFCGTRSEVSTCDVGLLLWNWSLNSHRSLLGFASKRISTDKFWENWIYMNTLCTLSRDFQVQALHMESYHRDSKRVFGGQVVSKDVFWEHRLGCLQMDTRISVNFSSRLKIRVRVSYLLPSAIRVL